jgi:hypothetical protein
MFGIDDAIMGGLIGGGLNLAGSLFSNASNRDIANQANQFSAQQYATRYQTTVKDMQAAGLNPMLAYGQGAGSAPSGQVGHQQQNVMASATEGYQKSTERNMINATISNLEKEGRIKDEALNTQREQTQLVAAQRDASLASSGLSSASAAKTYQDIDKEKANQPYWVANAKNNAESIVQGVNKIKQEIETGNASAAQLKALTAKVGVDINHVNALISLNTAQIAQTLASTSRTQADQAQIELLTRLSGYGENKLKNMSKAELSELKQTVSPYLEELRLLMESIRGAGSRNNVNN